MVMMKDEKTIGKPKENKGLMGFSMGFNGI